jgi:hypothetical protein
LLIYKYEEQMLRDRLDTVVSDAEIEQYFNQNASNFVLEENIVKALLSIYIFAITFIAFQKYNLKLKTFIN